MPRSPSRRAPRSAGWRVRASSSFPAAARCSGCSPTPRAASPSRARLMGTVRDGTGQPVPGAQVRLLGSATSTRSDEHGAYLLAGLPGGTQEVEVRRLGYGIARGPVTLRSEQRSRLDVVLDRVATLESFKVVARRWRYAEFEQHRKEALDGRFLDEAAIRKMNLNSSVDYVNALPGFRAVHVRWGEVKIVSMSDPGCSPVVL